MFRVLEEARRNPSLNLPKPRRTGNPPKAANQKIRETKVKNPEDFPLLSEDEVRDQSSFTSSYAAILRKGIQKWEKNLSKPFIAVQIFILICSMQGGEFGSSCFGRIPSEHTDSSPFKIDLLSIFTKVTNLLIFKSNRFSNWNGNF